MRILCVADIHIGNHSYGITDPETGLNTRVLNGLSSLDFVVDYAINNDFKIIAFAGDAYKNASPSRTMSNEFDKRINRISRAGIKLLMLDGNHDVSKMPQTKSPMAHFSTLDIPNVVHTRDYHVEDVTLDHETIRFVFLPTYHTAEEIEQLVNDTDTTTYPTIFLGHLTIKGAMLNDWNIAEKETYVDLGVFKKPGIVAVVMGHLHKPQVLLREPLVFYTGSLQRIDFSEEKQKKGFVVLDVKQDVEQNVEQSVTYDFIEVPSQEFFTLKTSVVGEDGTDQVIALLDKNTTHINNAIFRLIIDMNRNISINEGRIIEHAYNLGAHYVLDIRKNYPPTSIARIPGLTEDLSEEDALKKFYEGQDDADRKIKRGIEIIENLRREDRL